MFAPNIWPVIIIFTNFPRTFGFAFVRTIDFFWIVDNVFTACILANLNMSVLRTCKCTIIPSNIRNLNMAAFLTGRVA
ncbi:MAG TPA: hypothetical protein PKD85_04675 [Saprospiraceae bacterium]|nr:hypothetical protein [Saprospiraceae bacterium]